MCKFQLFIAGNTAHKNFSRASVIMAGEYCVILRDFLFSGRQLRPIDDRRLFIVVWRTHVICSHLKSNSENSLMGKARNPGNSNLCSAWYKLIDVGSLMTGEAVCSWLQFYDHIPACPPSDWVSTVIYPLVVIEVNISLIAFSYFWRFVPAFDTYFLG